MKTLMSETKWCVFEPAEDPRNPHLIIHTHKTRPVLAEVLDPNRKRRSLSALLNSRQTDPLIDDDPKFLNDLHSFEKTHVQQVAPTAPHKGPRPFSSLREGRDPRTRQRRPFLTYEGAPMTKAERKKFEQKQCHLKVMTDRVQYYNKTHFVPKSKQSGSDAPLPPSCVDDLNDFFKIPENGLKSDNQTPSGEPNEPKKPSKIIEDLYCSNVGDIIKNMSVHDQMRTIHNIMANEEFKKEREKLAKESREQLQQAMEEAAKKVESQISEGCWGSDCICSRGDAKELEMRKKQEETEEDEKPKEITVKKEAKKPTKQTGKWQKAEDYIPESQRSLVESQIEKVVKMRAQERQEALDSKFHNLPALGNLDTAKELKAPVIPPIDGLQSTKTLLMKAKEGKPKQESTKKTGTWQVAEPLQKLSKEDKEKIEAYEQLKQQRLQKELEIVKKFVNESNDKKLRAIGNSPVRGDNAKPESQ